MKKTRTKYLRAAAVTIAAILLALDAAFIILPDRSSSETENRLLQLFPRPDWSSVTSGRFESRFEDYVADQFPFRDVWITVKSAADRLLGRVESGGIFLGGDGYLIRDFQAPSAESREALKAIGSFAARHGDIPHYLLIAPSALTVLSGKLPALVEAGDEAGWMDRAEADLSGSVTVVDVRQALIEAAKTEQVYYRTDHHWTTGGARRAWLVLAEAMGLQDADAPGSMLPVTDAFSGTLTAGSGFRVTEKEPIHIWMPDREIPQIVTYVSEGQRSPTVYRTEFLSTRDKYAVFFGGNHPEIRIEVPSGTGALLVIKDSYANCLVPFMIPHFRKIVMVDPRYYTGEIDTLVEAEGITAVLYLYNAQTLSRDTALAADLM